MSFKSKYRLEKFAGLLGYSLFTLCIIQSVSLVTVVFLQFTITNNIDPAEENPKPDLIDVLSTPPTTHTTHEIASPAPDTLLATVIWMVPTVIALFLIIRTAKLSAKLVHFIVKKYWGRIMAKRLLTAKLGALAVSLAIIMLSSLLIPAVRLIVPLNIAFAAIGAICFIAQHAIYRHRRTPVKYMV